MVQAINASRGKGTPRPTLRPGVQGAPQTSGPSQLAPAATRGGPDPLHTTQSLRVTSQEPGSLPPNKKISHSFIPSKSQFVPEAQPSPCGVSPCWQSLPQPPAALAAFSGSVRASPCRWAHQGPARLLPPRTQRCPDGGDAQTPSQTPQAVL